ncbi:2,3,4,5-tetrahydropyridine-2,6-dicarboxylate N-succinyltransferase, partial [Sulfurihydrogenibium yellowstonense SS-5]
MEELKKLILEAWENRELLKENKYKEAVRETIDLLDNGKIRVAEKI